MAAPKKQIPAGRWWTLLARPRVRDYEAGYSQLSRDLQKFVGRSRPWNHAVFSRFVATGHISGDLANALSDFFHLPKPFWVARSMKEAMRFQIEAAKYDAEPVNEIEAEIIEMEARLEQRRKDLELAAKKEAEQAPIKGPKKKHG